MGNFHTISSSLVQENPTPLVEPVFVIPRNIYFTPSQMSIMIEAGQQPGVPFRVGGQGASRPSRPITKGHLTENLAMIDKSSFKIFVHDSGKFYVTFSYDSVINLSLYIHFGAKDPLSPDELRPQHTMLHWGPFSLKAGTRVLWSSEDENLYGDIINLPCAGVGILDAVVILDTSSNLNNSPRTDEANEREIVTSGKGWNPSGIGRLLSPQPHHRTKSPSNGEYRMTSSQSDAQRRGNYISRSASYFLARPPVAIHSAPSARDQSSSSSDFIEDSVSSVGSPAAAAPSSSHRKKSRHSSKKSERQPHTKAVKISPSFRGILPTSCVLQRVQLNQTGRIYVTEDLYGMDRSPENPQPLASGGEGNDGDDGAGGGQLVDNDSAECVICMTDLKEVAVYPCRHMCMCLTCAEALPSQNNKCPMCRRPALLLLRLKVWSDDPSAPSGGADSAKANGNGAELGDRGVTSRNVSPHPTAMTAL